MNSLFIHHRIATIGSCGSRPYGYCPKPTVSSCSSVRVAVSVSQRSVCDHSWSRASLATGVGTSSSLGSVARGPKVQCQRPSYIAMRWVSRQAIVVTGAGSGSRSWSRTQSPEPKARAEAASPRRRTDQAGRAGSQRYSSSVRPSMRWREKSTEERSWSSSRPRRSVRKSMRRTVVAGCDTSGVARETDGTAPSRAADALAAPVGYGDPLRGAGGADALAVGVAADALAMPAPGWGAVGADPLVGYADAALLLGTPPRASSSAPPRSAPPQSAPPPAGPVPPRARPAGSPPGPPADRARRPPGPPPGYATPPGYPAPRGSAAPAPRGYPPSRGSAASPGHPASRSAAPPSPGWPAPQPPGSAPGSRRAASGRPPPAGRARPRAGRQGPWAPPPPHSPPGRPPPGPPRRPPPPAGTTPGRH